MKKHGFTLIELILSIVLVTIIIVTMVGTLLKIRESYSIINQNIEARTYKALIAKVINEHFMKNGGVKNINCLSNTKCELLLGNNKTMTLEIIENDIKTEEVKDSTNNVVATRKIQTSTLKYYGNQYDYLKTLKSVKTTYVNSDVIIDGYAFKKITSNVYEYINVKNSELKDTITSIIIETSDPNYNIELYSTAIVDKDEFKRLYTLTYNNNGGSGCYKTVAKDGEYWGTTENPLCIPNVSPVGYSFYGWFNQPSRGNEILNNVTRADGNITAYAQWTNKRFSCPSGQYLPKNSMSCEECLEDNYCPGVTDELFDKFEDQGIIPCNVGYHSESGKSSPSDCKITCSANTYLANSNDSSCTDCSHGYSTSEHSVLQGNTSSCAANTYIVTFDKQSGSGGTNSVIVTYDSAMPSATMPTRNGYIFDGYYTGTNGNGTQYYNSSGTSTRNWDIASDTTLYAKWKVIPTCTLTASSSGVSLIKTNASKYGMSTSNAATYNSITSMSLSENTFYGFVESSEQVTNSCSVNIVSKNITSYYCGATGSYAYFGSCSCGKSLSIYDTYEECGANCSYACIGQGPNWHCMRIQDVNASYSSVSNCSDFCRINSYNKSFGGTITGSYVCPNGGLSDTSDCSYTSTSGCVSGYTSSANYTCPSGSLEISGTNYCTK